MTAVSQTQYAELHCHSSFSLLDGASNPEELVERAVELGLAALALTDHDDMGGMVRFAQAAKELELPGIVGAELTLEGENHLILLAQDLVGYKNLCHLITKARMHCQRGTPRVQLADLDACSRGLVALSGCPRGTIPLLLAQGRRPEAEAATRNLLDIYGANLFLELWNHELAQEAVICRELLELSKRYAIPWVVTNNVHYAAPNKRAIHDVLTCIKHETTLAAAGRRLRPNGTWYMRSPAEMARIWRHHPEGLSNTLVAAERCQFRLELLKPQLPACRTPAGLNNNQWLSQLVWEGAAERYGHDLSAKHIQQINHELDVIARLDLAPYFLIMWEIVQYAESQNIAVQGRGSAANSAVCYCLKITAVDPIGMDLLFERFVSEGRNEPPDIDLDIAHQEREKVLQHVYSKYGKEHAAMVCEHITYRGPSAVRDAARVFGFSPEQADRLAAQSDYHEATDAAVALAGGGARLAGLDPQDKRVQLFIQVVAGLNQLPRHRSIHVGGFVLAGEPIGDVVPVEPAAMAGRTVIQWDKDDLEFVGLIKVDLLGLGMLTLIQEAVKLIKQHRQIDVDLARLDMDDQRIYTMLQKADTIGVFQVESRAQMSILPKLRPTCFYDIVVSIALVRPGPIQGNIVHPYLKRRRGLEAVRYLHPSLEPILKRTLGVPLFQEQGMRLAVVAAGFTPSQADHLRRVMSHKRSLEKMSKICVELSEGMARNGFSAEAIETITFQLKAFANYGFPESHSASFSLLVYASAYLKCYFAPEFYCAILNAQPMGFYSPATLIRDAIRHGVKVLPTDVTASQWDCTLEDDADNNPRQPALRIGMRYVQGLGKRSRAALEKAWTTGGAFTSLEDLCRRSGLRAKDLERLAIAGTLESLCTGRRNALWQVLAITKQKDEKPLFRFFQQSRPVKQKIQDISTNQEGSKSNANIIRHSSSGGSATAAHRSAGAGSHTGDHDPACPPDLPAEIAAELPAQIPAMHPLEETIADYRMLGLSTGQHPMCYYRPQLARRKIPTCAGVVLLPHGQFITAAGGVICRQRPMTAKGFVFLTLEDETGMVNVIVRPKIFAQYRQVIMKNNFLQVSGRLQSEEGVINVLASSFIALPLLTDERSLHLRPRNFH